MSESPTLIRTRERARTKTATGRSWSTEQTEILMGKLGAKRKSFVEFVAPSGIEEAKCRSDGWLVLGHRRSKSFRHITGTPNSDASVRRFLSSLTRIAPRFIAVSAINTSAT